MECKDCSKEITNDEYAEGRGKCGRCAIGDEFA